MTPLTVISSLCIASVERGGNLLTNPGFEGSQVSAAFDAANPLSPVVGSSGGWNYRIRGSAYIRSESAEPYSYGPSGILEVHSGSDALYIASLQGGTVEIYQDVKTRPGIVYEAGACVRMYNADGQGFGASKKDFVHLCPQLVSEDGKQTADASFGCRLSGPNSKYQLFRTLLQSEAGLPIIRYMIRVHIECNHWHGCVKIDDCWLCAVQENGGN